MPTVPVVDQTAMGAQPYTAPSVTPMRNAAPQQTEQVGQTETQAGGVAFKTGQTIGDAVNAQVDDAKVNQAVVAAKQQEMEINHNPETGFMNLRGQQAVDGLETAKGAVAKAYQDQYDTLTNPLQQQRFNQFRGQELPEVSAKMYTHTFQQASQMSGEAAVSAANMGAASATFAYKSYGKTDGFGNPTGDFEKNLSAAEAATLNAVHVMKGAPPDSDIAKEALLNLHTQVGTGVLSQMMDARAPYAKVQKVYDDLKAKGMLDLRAQDTLGKMVKTYTEQESVRSVGNQSLSDEERRSQGKPTSATGTPDYTAAMKGGSIVTQAYDPDKGTVTVNAPAGSDVQAPADGTIEGILEDGKGSLGMQIRQADGSLTSFYGLSATTAKAGDKVQQGEVLATGAGPVQWSLADKNGAAVDPTKAGLAPVDLTKITDEKVLSAALESMRKKITDPYLQQQATSEMESIVRHNQQMANAQATQTFKQASDAFYNGGMQWRSIPPSTFNQLTGEQQQHFKDTQTNEILKNYNQGQAFKEMSETDLVSDFVTNPETLTPENVDKARPQLANSTYLALMRQAQAQQTNPKGVQEATGITDRIKYFAAPAGINVTPKEPADKQKMIDLTYKVNNAIDQIKTYNHGKATPQQVDDAIKQQLIQTTVGNLPHSASNPLVVLGAMPNEAPKQYQFEMPDGATQVMRGSDGKMHYMDSTGKKDLGVVK